MYCHHFHNGSIWTHKICVTHILQHKIGNFMLSPLPCSYAFCHPYICGNRYIKSRNFDVLYINCGHHWKCTRDAWFWYKPTKITYEYITSIYNNEFQDSYTWSEPALPNISYKAMSEKIYLVSWIAYLDYLAGNYSHFTWLSNSAGLILAKRLKSMIVICLAISSGSKSNILRTGDELVGNCERRHNRLITPWSTNTTISAGLQVYTVV